MRVSRARLITRGFRASIVSSGLLYWQNRPTRASQSPPPEYSSGRFTRRTNSNRACAETALRRASMESRFCWACAGCAGNSEMQASSAIDVRRPFGIAASTSAELLKSCPVDRFRGSLVLKRLLKRALTRRHGVHGGSRSFFGEYELRNCAVSYLSPVSSGSYPLPATC